jgi:hypothetical protein
MNTTPHHLSAQGTTCPSDGLTPPRSPHPRRTRPVNRPRRDPATNAPTQTPPLQMLLAELVELGRQAWQISEQERALRAQIDTLRAMEENQ